MGNLSDDEGEGRDDDDDDEQEENDSEPDENDEPSEEVPVAGVVSEDSVHEPTTLTATQHSPVCQQLLQPCMYTILARECH